MRFFRAHDSKSPHNPNPSRIERFLKKNAATEITHTLGFLSSILASQPYSCCFLTEHSIQKNLRTTERTEHVHSHSRLDTLWAGLGFLEHTNTQVGSAVRSARRPSSAKDIRHEPERDRCARHRKMQNGCCRIATPGPEPFLPRFSMNLFRGLVKITELGTNLG